MTFEVRTSKIEDRCTTFTIIFACFPSPLSCVQILPGMRWPAFCARIRQGSLVPPSRPEYRGSGLGIVRAGGVHTEKVQTGRESGPEGSGPGEGPGPGESGPRGGPDRKGVRTGGGADQEGIRIEKVSRPGESEPGGVRTGRGPGPRGGPDRKRFRTVVVVVVVVAAVVARARPPPRCSTSFRVRVSV